MQTVGSGSCRTVTRVRSSGRKRDEPSDFLTRPSRPGRLMEVTACQDLHETPRTPLGLPQAPAPRRPTASFTSRGGPGRTTLGSMAEESTPLAARLMGAGARGAGAVGRATGIDKAV